MLSSSLLQHSDGNVSLLDIPSPAVKPDLVNSMTDIELIKEQLNLIDSHPTPKREDNFHKLERNFVIKNEELIVKQALAVSQDLSCMMEEAAKIWDPLHHFRFDSNQNYTDSLIFRYVHVPLAYRLGYYTLAAKISQMTFEALLPNIEKRIGNSLRVFTGHSESDAHSLVHERFATNLPVGAYSYSRPKTPHSVWKKAKSVRTLELMSPHEFSTRIDDYVGVVWIMPIHKGENRFDALINASRHYSKDFQLLKISKSLSCHMEEGFPVSMIHSVWRSIPIEVQFLGGEILGWLASMDYGKYKMGTWLDKIDERLSPTEWRKRGNTILRLYEKNPLKMYEEVNRPEFHRLLLSEVLGKQVTYDQTGPNIPIYSKKPEKAKNSEFSYPKRLINN